MIASLTESTLKQYEKPIRLWWIFCIEKNISPFDATIEYVITYLTDIFKNVGAYGTVNSYRSALSLVLSYDIGKDAMIKRLFKGISVLKPQRPKYDCTWDPSSVLEYLKTLYPNETISLEKLSLKLVALIALSTGQRMQTLSKISLENIIVSSEQIQIKISERVKTSKIHKNQPCLVIPFFRNQPEICVASTLQNYIEATASLRNLKEGNNSLFISYCKPHRVVTTQTLARWTKRVLSASGVDTSVFTAHSTRHASTSAVSRAGLNVDIIRKTAGWSERSSVFARFYNRPLDNRGAFAMAIINT